MDRVSGDWFSIDDAFDRALFIDEHCSSAIECFKIKVVHFATFFFGFILLSNAMSTATNLKDNSLL